MVDKRLFEKISDHKAVKKCKGCGKKMIDINLNRVYCDECISKR